jgi:hypothetical protein
MWLRLTICLSACSAKKRKRFNNEASDVCGYQHLESLHATFADGFVVGAMEAQTTTEAVELCRWRRRQR